MTLVISRGPGLPADPNLPAERWGGRRAQEFVRLCRAEYGVVCWLCGLPGADSADHVIPVSKGGAVYALANLAPAHRSCNYARGNRAPIGPAALIENGEAFFSPPALDTHAQPLPFPPESPNKTEIEPDENR